MHITVHCPSCHSRYQLNPEMRGKRMRCPNPICREIFEAREEAADPPAPPEASPPAESAETAVPHSPRRPPTPPEKRYVAGSIGELVPFLTADAVEPSPEIAPAPPAEPAQAAAEAPSWQQAPPVRRQAEPPPEPPPAPAPQVPAWQQAPPPVRKSAQTVPPSPVPAEPPPVRVPAPRTSRETVPSAASAENAAPVSPQPPEPPPVRRKPTATQTTPFPPPAVEEKPAKPIPGEGPSLPTRRNTAKWAILVMVTLVLTIAGVGIWYGISHAAQTEADLVEKAKEAYQSNDFAKAAGFYEQLLKNFPESGNVAEYRFLKELCGVRGDVFSFGSSADKAQERLEGFIRKYASDDLLTSYRHDLHDTYDKLIDKVLPPDTTVTAASYDAVLRDYGKARDLERESRKYAPDGTSPDLAKRLASVQTALEKFKLVRDQVAKIKGIEKWTMERLRELDQENKWLGFDQHPEVKDLMRKAARALLFDDNRFFPHPKGTALRPPAEDTARTVLVTPRLDPPGGPQLNADGVVFALARGVLYALNTRDGHVLWFVRVGIDTSTLPVRLPKGEANPHELVLVLSSDTNTLTARDALTGEAYWQYTLSAPCLGRPVLVGRRAYVPTIDGRVHEIEIVAGNVLGEYRLSLGLSGAGAHQEGTSLLYFPAERDFVYVLDVEKKQCVAMLHSGHPSGSLRGDPIIVSDDALAPGGQTAPRYLILGVTDGLDAVRLRAYRLPIEGLADVPPLRPELRVRGWSWFQPACDGEKVVLATDAGVLGLYGINQYQNQDQPLFPLFPNEIKLEGDEDQLGRAQVVQVADQDFWCLARGHLQQWRMGLGPDGQKAAAVWLQPLALGSPLHGAQVSRNGDTLFVVTHSPARQVCLATAVEAATGKVRWQRQLGLTVRDDLLPVAGRVVALDHGGGLFLLDPEKDRLTPPARGEPSAQALHLLPGPDSESVYVLSRPERGRLRIRRHGLTQKAAGSEPREFSVPAPLAGTPAVGGNFLVLPLASGAIARQSLVSKTGIELSLPWRAPHADAGARGHVVYLGNDEFLVSDGSTGLLRLSWPEKQVWSVKAEGTVDNRIVSAPLLLRSDMAPRVCVADSGGNVVLLDALKLKPIRRWSLEGRITAGPFVRGKRVGCVVDHHALVWLDPVQAKPLWKYQTPGDGIVGEPHQTGDTVIVADSSGRFIALDAETGQPRGPGYSLKASAAPAVAPVAFGPDRVLAPLTDGTVLLLMREHLVKP